MRSEGIDLQAKEKRLHLAACRLVSPQVVRRTVLGVPQAIFRQLAIPIFQNSGGEELSTEVDDRCCRTSTKLDTTLNNEVSRKECVVITDPFHPLFGRTLTVSLRGKTPGKDGFVYVENPKYPEQSFTRLNHEAIFDFCQIAKEATLQCRSSPKKSGQVSAKKTEQKLKVNSPKSAGR